MRLWLYVVPRYNSLSLIKSQVAEAQCVCHIGKHREHEAKFRSGNLLENGDKNRRNLPCDELLLSLIRTRSFGKMVPFTSLHNHSMVYGDSLYYEGRWKGPFSRNFVYVLRTTTAHHKVSFIDFYFHFLANFPDLNFASYVLCIYLWHLHVAHTVNLGYLCLKQSVLFWHY